MLMKVKDSTVILMNAVTSPDEGVGAGSKDRGGRRPLRSSRGWGEQSRGGGRRGQEMLQEAAVAMTTILSSWPDLYVQIRGSKSFLSFLHVHELDRWICEKINLPFTQKCNTEESPALRLQKQSMVYYESPLPND